MQCEIRQLPGYSFHGCRQEAILVMRPYGGGLTLRLCAFCANRLVNQEPDPWPPGEMIKTPKP